MRSSMGDELADAEAREREFQEHADAQALRAAAHFDDEYDPWNDGCHSALDEEASPAGDRLRCKRRRISADNACEYSGLLADGSDSTAVAAGDTGRGGGAGAGTEPTRDDYFCDQFCGKLLPSIDGADVPSAAGHSGGLDPLRTADNASATCSTGAVARDRAPPLGAARKRQKTMVQTAVGADHGVACTPAMEALRLRVKRKQETQDSEAVPLTRRRVAPVVLH
jgi:hypothetical protein